MITRLTLVIALLAAVAVGGCGSDDDAGASAGMKPCGDGIFVGPHTSCRFGKSMERSYYAQSKRGLSQFRLSGVVDATNPENGLVYTLHCTFDSPHHCSGRYTGVDGGTTSSASFP